jgi:hypothetical protein
VVAIAAELGGVAARLPRDGSTLHPSGSTSWTATAPRSCARGNGAYPDGQPDQPLADSQAPLVLASSLLRGMSSKVGRMRFSTFLRVPYSEVGCWSLGRPPLGRDVLAEQRPGPLQVNLGSRRRARRGYARWPASRRVLGAWSGRSRRSGAACPAGSRPSSARGVARDGGTTTTQAMYYASLSEMASWVVTHTPHEFRMVPHESARRTSLPSQEAHPQAHC